MEGKTAKLPLERGKAEKGAVLSPIKSVDCLRTITLLLARRPEIVLFLREHNSPRYKTPRYSLLSDWS